MRQQVARQAAGETLAIQLARAETAVENALSEVALFAALLPKTRTAAQLSATTGQSIFEATARALTTLAETRGHMAEAHRKLEILGRRIGFDIESVGPVDKPDDTPPIGDGPRLSAISSHLGKQIPTGHA